MKVRPASENGIEQTAASTPNNGELMKPLRSVARDNSRSVLLLNLLGSANKSMSAGA